MRFLVSLQVMHLTNRIPTMASSGTFGMLQNSVLLLGVHMRLNLQPFSLICFPLPAEHAPIQLFSPVKA